MSDSLFHSYSNEVALILLSDHLVKLTHMHRVEDRLADRYLSWRLNVHALLNAETKPFVLCRVYAINAECIGLSVVVKRFYFETAANGLFINLSYSAGLLLNLSVAGTGNPVTHVEQVVHIPNVISVFVQIDGDLENAFFEVDSLSFDFHSNIFNMPKIPKGKQRKKETH